MTFKKGHKGFTNWRSERPDFKPWNKGLTKETDSRIKAPSTVFKKGNMVNFKGGRTKNWGGYTMIYSPDHPFKTARNTVREHRLVMEKHVGRFLSHEERVHHIDFDKSNNDIDNLCLFSNEPEHQLYHQFLQRLVRTELENGYN